jgi:hypothetical protein
VSPGTTAGGRDWAALIGKIYIERERDLLVEGVEPAQVAEHAHHALEFRGVLAVVVLYVERERLACGGRQASPKVSPGTTAGGRDWAALIGKQGFRVWGLGFGVWVWRLCRASP